MWTVGSVTCVEPSDAEVFGAVFIGFPPWLRYVVVGSTVIGSERAVVLAQLGSGLLLFVLILISSNRRQVSTQAPRSVRVGNRRFGSGVSTLSALTSHGGAAPQ